MDITGTKILVASLFGITRFLFGVLPIKIFKLLNIQQVSTEGEEEDGKKVTCNVKRHQQVQCGLALFQSFGGGVIFATCFLHMIPEVYESTIKLKDIGLILSHYPFSQLIVSLGFFLIYFIEEVANYFISKVPDVQCRNHKDLTNNRVIPLDEAAADESITVIEEFVNEECPSPVKEAQQQQDVELNGVVDEMKQNEVNADKSKELYQVHELNEIMTATELTQQTIVRGILIVLALSLHSFFEGLAIGLQTSIGSIWYLFIAITVHSATILFVISFELLLANARLKIIIIHVLILSIVSPLGVLLGLLFSFRTEMNSYKTVAVVFLEGLSAGTILYITFFEVLNREKERRVYRLRRAFFIMLGFAIMACLECGEIYY